MFELPENLGDLSSEELQALIDQGLDAWNALGLTAESDEATIVEGERIAPLINALRAEQRTRETAAADRRTRATGLLDSMATTPEEPEQPEGEPETPETPEAETVVVPDAVIQPEPVAAAARTSPARRAAANAAPPAVPRSTPMVAALTAAADVPGIPTGAPLDGLTAAATAVINRWKGFPTTRIGGPDGVRHRYGAALIRKQGYGQLMQDTGLNDFDLVAAAGQESRLPGGSLTAAGGWCSPSETLYDLCQYETVQGILDLPEIGIPRGGIRWTPGPDFGDIYTACGFFGTEAEAIAGTMTKDCCEVECPDFDEIRADLVGLCVTAPLITQATYPELIRRFMEGALVAHQHKVNKYLIDIIKAAAGTPSVADDAGATSLSLAGIGFAALGMRYRYRMGDSTTIEVVAPYWLKEVIKEDLGMRHMSADNSDAAVNAWFTRRNLSVQWVFDLQDPTVTGCLVTIPATATVLLYPAGTWVKGSIDVINLDAVYDSTNLASNTYTALFVEEGILAVQRCTHTCAINIPVCVSGRTAANDISECITAPAATAPAVAEAA